jgi:glycosyltransferase involved in cell wall biosynthesis
MIVKNEENNLKNCLESVCDLVDEINIVDTGSTDRTVEIAKQYTDRIFFFNWIDDFSAARNFSFSQATKEYIMWLDADDILEDRYREGFLRFKAGKNQDADYFMMGYILKKDANQIPVEISFRERIVKKSSNFKWTRAIHEIMNVSGKTENIGDVFITHNSSEDDKKDSLARNAFILQEIIKNGKQDMVDYYYYGVTLAAMGSYKEAVYPLEYFIENNNVSSMDMGAYTQLYKSYIDCKYYEKAYGLLALNEEKLKDYAEYYCHLGNFMEEVMKDFNKAVTYYKRALLCQGKTDENTHTHLHKNEAYYYYEPYHRLGQCYVKLRDYKNAGEAFKKAVTYRPNDNELAALTEKISKIAALIP